MQIRNGTCRTVLLIPSLGIVIKVAKIRLISAVVDFWPIRRRRLWGLKLASNVHGSPRWFLLRGIHDNWGEFVYYIWTRHPLLQPTYFSLLGLINIQRLTEPCTMNGRDLLAHISQLTNKGAWKDSHHFVNPNNFAYDGDKLKICDYGGPSTQELISAWGTKILTEFDPTFTRHYSD